MYATADSTEPQATLTPPDSSPAIAADCTIHVQNKFIGAV